MEFPSTAGATALNTTTRVLDDREVGRRPGFELQFLRGRRGRKHSRITSQEARAMGIEDQAKG